TGWLPCIKAGSMIQSRASRPVEQGSCQQSEPSLVTAVLSSRHGSCFELGWRDVVRRGGLNALDDHWDPVRALAARPRRTRRRRADPPAPGGGGGRVPHQPDHGPTPRGLTTTPRSVDGLVPIGASPKLFVE